MAASDADRPGALDAIRRFAARIPRGLQRLRYMLWVKYVHLFNVRQLIRIRGYHKALEQCFQLLDSRGVPIIVVAGPMEGEDYPYSSEMLELQRRDVSLAGLLCDPQYVDILRELYQREDPLDYAEQLSFVPPIRGYSRHWYIMDDYESELVNYVGGKRATCFQPENARRSLHVFGICTMLGTGLEDKDTFPSQLQRKLVEGGHGDIRVENCAMIGPDHSAHLQNLIIESPKYDADDIVLIYAHVESEVRLLEELGCTPYRIDEVWPRNEITTGRLIKDLVHLGPEAQGILVDLVYKRLEADGFKTCYAPKRPMGELDAYRRFLKMASSGMLGENTDRLCADILERVPEHLRDAERRGVIVMNANPFTLGHRHLVEYAASQVDLLFVFCASADTSRFSAEERLKLVEEGCADLDNVVVSTSGSVFINTETFPEYFIHEFEFDKKEVGIDDIAVFGRYVAPALGIKVRFVGQEIPDSLTEAYNRNMEQELPRYGIEFVEIPRVEHDGAVISATTVRRLMDEGDLEGLRGLVPPTTFRLIEEKLAAEAGA